MEIKIKMIELTQKEIRKGMDFAVSDLGTAGYTIFWYQRELSGNLGPNPISFEDSTAVILSNNTSLLELTLVDEGRVGESILGFLEAGIDSINSRLEREGFGKEYRVQGLSFSPARLIYAEKHSSAYEIAAAFGGEPIQRKDKLTPQVLLGMTAYALISSRKE